MQSKKLSRKALKELEKMLMKYGNYEYLEQIKEANLFQLRNSGKFLYFLLKIGYSPIDIDQMLGIRVRTIERRILEELRLKDYSEDTYEDYSFIFENIIGFPLIDMYRRYINFDLGEKGFIIREGLDKYNFKIIKELFSTNGMKKYESEIRLKRRMLFEEEIKKRGKCRGVKRHIKPGLNPSFKLS